MIFSSIFKASSPECRGRAVHPIKWRSKYGRMEVSDAKRLKALEEENSK